MVCADAGDAVQGGRQDRDADDRQGAQRLANRGEEMRGVLFEGGTTLLAPFSTPASCQRKPDKRVIVSLHTQALDCLADCSVARDFSLSFHLSRLTDCSGGGSKAIDKSSLRYICDPRNEDVEGPSGVVQREEGVEVISAAIKSDIVGRGGWQGVVGEILCEVCMRLRSTGSRDGTFLR